MSKKLKPSGHIIDNPVFENNLPTELKLKQWLVLLILTSAVFISYFNIWQNGLVWDDDPYILLNDAVKNFDFKALLKDFHVGNYHPLTMLTLAIEYTIAGENPDLYHFNNLLLHALNSFLVFKILSRLSKNQWVGLLSSLFFALHPLHVESVAWAAERKDVLYTLFLLLSFNTYLDYVASSSKAKYTLALILFLLSCLSKGMAVVLPAILLITDWWFLGRSFSIKNTLDKLPFFLISLIFAYIATTAQKDAGADASSVIAAAYNTSERIRIVSYAYLFYWIKTIYPVDLLPFYPYPTKIGGTIPGIYNFALVVLVLILLAVYFFGKRNKAIWWSFGFFTIAISTVIQILPVGSAIVADRYYYLSSIGPLYLISYFMVHKLPKLMKPIGMAVAIVFAGLTFDQVTHWKNGFTLFKPAEQFYPEDAMIISNIGWYHLGQKEFPKAKEYLMRADNNGFKNADVCRTIGSMFIDEGNYEQAIVYIQRAYQYLPVKPRTDWLMALALNKSNKAEQALPYAEKAVSGEPENIDYHSTLSEILLKTGNFEKSRAINQQLMAENPASLDAKLNYAYAFRQEGNIQKEIDLLKQLIEEAPDYLPAYRNLGVSYSDLGKHDDAVKLWEKAAQMDNSGDYEYNIGINYAMRNRINDAKPWYVKAARKGKKEAIDILRKNGESF